MLPLQITSLYHPVRFCQKFRSTAVDNTFPGILSLIQNTKPMVCALSFDNSFERLAILTHERIPTRTLSYQDGRLTEYQSSIGFIPSG